MHAGYDPHGFAGLLHAVPAYSGTDIEDPVRWILRIERIATALNCSDDSKFAAAISRLEGGALDWSEGHMFTTWTEFKASFVSRYGESAEVLRHKLHKCRMTAGESIHSFIDRFRMLAMRAQIQDPEYILNRFLAGLSNAIYDRVVVCCPTRYEEAVEKAIYFASKLMLNDKNYQLNVRTTPRSCPCRMEASMQPHVHKELSNPCAGPALFLNHAVKKRVGLRRQWRRGGQLWLL